MTTTNNNVTTTANVTTTTAQTATHTPVITPVDTTAADMIALGVSAYNAKMQTAARRNAAKDAIAAYMATHTAREILAAPAVTYTHEGNTYTAYITPAAKLDNETRRHDVGTGTALTDRQLLNLHAKKLALCVAADAARNICNINAPRTARKNGFMHVAAMAKLLGYPEYPADNARDWDYLKIGMERLTAAGDIAINAALKAVCKMLYVRLNNINVRVLLNGGKVEYSVDLGKKKPEKKADKKVEKKAEKQSAKKPEKKAETPAA